MRWNSATWNFLKGDFYHSDVRRYTHNLLLLLSLLYSLFKKWTIPGKFFLDVGLLPRPLSFKKEPLKPLAICVILSECAFFFHFWSLSLHLQFVMWSSFLQPLLISHTLSHSNSSIVLVYMMIEIAWTEPLLSERGLGVRREVFAVLAFVGEAIVLSKVLGGKTRNIHMKLEELDNE